MAPRGYTNPAPQTASARAQIAAFYCSLCGKGYARQNEFAAHEASYEHNHNQRRKDLRSMNMAMAKGSGSSGGGSSDGMLKVKPITLGEGKSTGGAGFKKGGFKSAFTKVAGPGPGPGPGSDDKSTEVKTEVVDKPDAAFSRDESESEDEAYEKYDPRRPTGCGPECRAQR